MLSIHNANHWHSLHILDKVRNENLEDKRLMFAVIGNNPYVLDREWAYPCPTVWYEWINELVDQMFHQEDSISHQTTCIYIHPTSQRRISWPYSSLCSFSFFFLYDFSSLTVRISREHRMSNAFAFAHTRFVYTYIWEKKSHHKHKRKIKHRPTYDLDHERKCPFQRREGEEIQNLHIYNRLVRLTRSPPFIMIINSVL
jgi:hypothetical protein